MFCGFNNLCTADFENAGYYFFSCKIVYILGHFSRDISRNQDFITLNCPVCTIPYLLSPFFKIIIRLFIPPPPPPPLRPLSPEQFSISWSCYIRLKEWHLSVLFLTIFGPPHHKSPCERHCPNLKCFFSSQKLLPRHKFSAIADSRSNNCRLYGKITLPKTRLFNLASNFNIHIGTVCIVNNGFIWKSGLIKTVKWMQL